MVAISSRGQERLKKAANELASVYGEKRIWSCPRDLGIFIIRCVKLYDRCNFKRGWWENSMVINAAVPPSSLNI
jgi:hypothetical protein